MAGGWKADMDTNMLVCPGMSCEDNKEEACGLELSTTSLSI